MQEWAGRWVAKSGKSNIYGLDVAGDFTFHSFAMSPADLIVSERQTGAVVFQHTLKTSCHGAVASRKGPKALFACYSGDVVLVELTGRQWNARTVVKLNTCANHAVWNASQTLIAVACSDKHVYVFDATSFHQIAKLGPLSGNVWRVAFSPDANLLYAIDYASEVRVFGLVDGASWSEIAVVSQLQTGGGDCRGLAVSPDGRHVAGFVVNVGVCMWKVPEKPLKRDSWEGITPVSTVKGYGPAYGICFARPDHLIVADYVQSAVRVFSVANDGRVDLVTALSTEVKPYSVAFDADAGTLLVGHQSGTLHALQAKNYTRKPIITSPTEPSVVHVCARSRKSTISARIAKIDGDIAPLAKALGADGLRAADEIAHLTAQIKRLEAELNGARERLASLRSKHGEKVDQLGALKGERDSLISELTEIDRTLSGYLSHVSGGAHQVSAHDIGIALCDSGVCSTVTPKAMDAIDQLGASTGLLIGKSTADLAASLEMSYSATSGVVAELERLIALGRDLPTSVQQPLPPRTGMLAWKHADVIMFLEKATVEASIVAAFKAQPRESAWGGPALAFADYGHIVEAARCTVAQANGLVALISKEKERQIAAKQLPPWQSTWTVSTKFSRTVDPEAELAEVIAEMAALELQFGPPPPNITCPITKRAMKDPVTAADDTIYERLALAARIAQGNRMSDVDPSVELTNDVIASVRTKKAVDRWRGIIA